MKLTLQRLRQGPGQETPEFSAGLMADGVWVANVTSEGRGGQPFIEWADQWRDEQTIDRKKIMAEVLKRAIKFMDGDPVLIRVLKKSPVEAFMFLPDVVSKTAGGPDLDQLAEGIFQGYAPDGDPWSGGAPRFQVSFSGIKAARHSISPQGEISAVIESGSDGVFADSHLFWRFLKAYPTGESALLKAFAKFFKLETPRLKADIVKHFTDPDFGEHLTGAVFGWQRDSDWETPTNISVGQAHFYKPRVSHSSIHVLWVVDVGFTTSKKPDAGSPFTGMSDKELNKWIGIWEGLGPENFWMDGELRATRPQAYKMYRSRWRAMTPREQTRMYDDLKPYEGRRLASIKNVAHRFLRATPNALAVAVAAFLKSKSTKAGGRFRSVELDHGSVGAEPQNRQRLDHYGNDGDGWDEEGWEDAYASPLRKEVKMLLDREFPGNDFIVDVGEKGHVEVQGRSLSSGARPQAPQDDDDLPESWKRAAQEPLPLVERVGVFLDRDIKVQPFSRNHGFGGSPLLIEKVDVRPFHKGNYIDVYLRYLDLKVPSLEPGHYVRPSRPGPEDETFDYRWEEEWESEFLKPFNKMIVDQLDKAFPEARGRFEVASYEEYPYWIINIEHPDF